MATVTANKQFNNAAAADMNAWGGFIHSALITTCGWLATTDTGQTDPTTAVSNASIYEVFKTNDGLTPLFMRVDYINNGGTPVIGITLGTGTNGAGVITGGMGIMRTGNTAVPGGTGATTFACYASGDAGNFTLLMWRNSTNQSSGTASAAIIVNVERSRDGSGNATSDFATCYMGGVGINAVANSTGRWVLRQQSVFLTLVNGNAAGTAATRLFTWLTFAPAQSTAGFGANVAAMPVFPFVGYITPPSLNLLCVKAADFGEAATPSITVFGAAHTYLVTSQANGANTNTFGAVRFYADASLGESNQEDNQFALRYE